MARFGIHGFKIGDAIEAGLLPQVEGGFAERALGNVPSWGQAPVAPAVPAPEGIMRVADWDAESANASVEVTTWRSDMQVGPEGFYFKVTGYNGFDTPAPAEGETWDRRYHEFIFLWDFDDPGSRFTRPDNIMEHMRNANIGYGPQVGHTYTKPGTYRPSVIVYEPSTGKLAKHTLGPFTVKDPDILFAGAQTNYVHPDGDYSAAPTGAGTFTSIYDALKKARNGQPFRVMLALGVEHYMPGEHRFENGVGTYLRNVYVCAAPGGRAKVTTDKRSGELFYMIDKSPREDPGHGLDMTFVGVDIIGSWQSWSETGGRARAFTFSRGGEPDRKAQYFLLHDIFISGFDAGILYLGNSHQDNEDHHITSILSNTLITNWGDYAVFSGTNRMAFLGTQLTQHRDAMSGGWKNGAHNQHGCMRINGVDHAVMDGCDFFTYNGWWENINPYHTQQPVLRWNFMGHDDVHDMALNMQRSVCEGGETILAFQHMNTGKSVRNNNVRIDGVVFLASHMTSVPIKIAFGGVTTRRSMFVFPTTPRINFHLFEPKSAGAFINSGLVTGDEIDPIVWEHNTLVNRMLAAEINANEWKPEGVRFLRPDEVNVPLADGTIIERGNIVHQPNLAQPDIGFGPMSMLDSIPTYRTRGYKDGGGEAIRLTAPLAPGESVQIAHKGTDFGQPPSAYTDGVHFAKLGADEIATDQTVTRSGEVEISFIEGAAILKNTSEATWPKDLIIEYKWDRSRGSNPIARDGTYGSPPGTERLERPLANSKANGTGFAAAGVELDFFGIPRPTYPTSGAMNASRAIGRPAKVVVMGASIVEQSFGRDLVNPNTNASAKMIEKGRPVQVFGYGFGGEKLDSFTKRLDEVLAAHPDAIVVVHSGGNDVTATKPHATADLTLFRERLNVVVSRMRQHPGRVFLGSLTFRNYGGSTFASPENGSEPFNEQEIIPLLKREAPWCIGPSGRPYFDFYRWMISNHENWLEGDGIHPNSEGEEAMRKYVTDVLVQIMDDRTIEDMPALPERAA
ncbi:SGNH/GDSL hydrolase family protein [Palleronia sp. LCG004]|uniref:SGNH/GDSL hydrolase family protein n=1 Tax=Palleronia sp. LCG004 TaxID=3079304 RepID=UPI002943E15E|nr:SGNH/GDSL hydrolase family protein [Palleronia sp. LCG004]WOI54941.1 SGNH/GDSL hydrolase family protein [Palleronia sp. LCG004]